MTEEAKLGESIIKLPMNFDDFKKETDWYSFRGRKGFYEVSVDVISLYLGYIDQCRKQIVKLEKQVQDIEALYFAADKELRNETEKEKE